MGRLVQLLAVLLVLQIALIAGLNVTRTDLSTVSDRSLLISAATEEVDLLMIEGPDGGTVSLRKHGATWIVPEDGDFPADQEKVEAFISRVSELERGMPVGTTPAALSRFRVTESNFERRITLGSKDDVLTVFFLGTSPRARMTYARSRDDTSVYEVQLAAYDAPTGSEDWQDEMAVEIPYPDIVTLEIPGMIKMIRNRRPGSSQDTGSDAPVEDKVWDSPDLGPGEKIHQQSADALARKVSALRIIDVLGKDIRPGFGLDPPELTVSVETTSNDKVTYELGPIDGEKDYVFKASTRPEYFRLPDYLAKSLLKATHRDSLVRKSKEPTD
jgi:hypothetical protein